jgi:hypothetical protein
MSFWVAGAVVVGSVGGAVIQGNASSRAARAQQQASQQGIDETRRQFDVSQAIMAPYTDAGTEALTGLKPYVDVGPEALLQQRVLAGLEGPDKQREAINALTANPEFQALSRQGEEAILQNASATGGLRGGNIQGALAQYRPQMLQDYITQQYGRLGGLTQLGQLTSQNIAALGQASAAGQAAGALETGKNITGLLGDIGASRAGNALQQGQMWGSLLDSALQFGGAAKKAGKW